MNFDVKKIIRSVEIYTTKRNTEHKTSIELRIIVPTTLLHHYCRTHGNRSVHAPEAGHIHINQVNWEFILEEEEVKFIRLASDDEEVKILTNNLLSRVETLLNEVAILEDQLRSIPSYAEILGHVAALRLDVKNMKAVMKSLINHKVPDQHIINETTTFQGEKNAD